VSNNENYHHEETRLRVDVYHHFDVKTEELITTAIEVLKNSLVPTKIALDPGAPETKISK
jgi:phosphotransferase system IIB component